MATVTLTSGVATFTTSSLAHGQHKIVARYGGSGICPKFGIGDTDGKLARIASKVHKNLYSKRAFSSGTLSILGRPQQTLCRFDDRCLHCSKEPLLPSATSQQSHRA